MFSRRIKEKERTAMGYTRRISLAVVAVATMIVTVPRPVSATSQVPFHATIAEIDRGEALCPASQARFLCVTLTGDGQATHLGAVSESAVPVVDLTTLDPASGCIAEVRTSTLTAANGDQITLQGPGHTCVNTRTVTDSWVVISGTGRFAGATGSGTDSVVVDRTTSPVTAVTTFSGTLSSPGSLR